MDGDLVYVSDRERFDVSLAKARDSSMCQMDGCGDSSMCPDGWL